MISTINYNISLSIELYNGIRNKNFKNMFRGDIIKNIKFKSFLMGIIVTCIGIHIGLIAGQIKLSKFSSVKIMLDNNTIQLKHPLVSIVKSGKKDSRLYIPAQELLEYLGFMVDFNSNDNSINLIDTNIEKINEIDNLITNNKGENIQVYEQGIGENGKFITNKDYYNLNSGEELVFNLYKLHDGNMINQTYKKRQDLNLKIQIKNSTGTIESEIVINLNNSQENIVVKEDGQYQVIISNPQEDTALIFGLLVKKQNRTIY